MVAASIALALFFYSPYRDAPPYGDDRPAGEGSPPDSGDSGSQPGAGTAPDGQQPDTDGQQPDADGQEPEDGQKPPPGGDERTVDEGINQVRVAPDGTGVVAGLAPPGSTITLYNKGGVIGTADSSEQGDWVIAIDPPLEPGSHLLHVEIEPPEGETRVGGLAAVVELTGRDETPLVALVPFAGAPLDEDAPPKVLQGPDPETGGTGEQAGPGVNIRTVQTARQGTRIQVTGDARGGDSVALAVNGETAPAVPASEGGYTAEADLDPAAERHELLVTLRDGDGKSVASARVALTRANIEQTFGNKELVVVQKGDALWRIAYRTYGQGIRYQIIFEKNKDQIADKDLIYPDQIFVVPNE